LSELIGASTLKLPLAELRGTPAAMKRQRTARAV